MIIYIYNNPTPSIIQTLKLFYLLLHHKQNQYKYFQTLRDCHVAIKSNLTVYQKKKKVLT